MLIYWPPSSSAQVVIEAAAATETANKSKRPVLFRRHNSAPSQRQSRREGRRKSENKNCAHHQEEKKQCWHEEIELDQFQLPFRLNQYQYQYRTANDETQARLAAAAAAATTTTITLTRNVGTDTHSLIKYNLDTLSLSLDERISIVDVTNVQPPPPLPPPAAEVGGQKQPQPQQAELLSAPAAKVGRLESLAACETTNSEWLARSSSSDGGSRTAANMTAAMAAACAGREKVAALLAATDEKDEQTELEKGGLLQLQLQQPQLTGSKSAKKRTPLSRLRMALKLPFNTQTAAASASAACVSPSATFLGRLGDDGGGGGLKGDIRTSGELMRPRTGLLERRRRRQRRQQQQQQQQQRRRRRRRRPNFMIMISYSHKEASRYAIHLKWALQQLGLSVYLDVHEIRDGSDWQDSLNEAILECAAFVALVTPSYGETLWTSRELKLADILRKRIIPINFGLDRRWPPVSLALQLATMQYIPWWLPSDAAAAASSPGPASAEAAGLLLAGANNFVELSWSARDHRRSSDDWPKESVERVAQQIKHSLLSSSRCARLNDEPPECLLALQLGELLESSSSESSSPPAADSDGASTATTTSSGSSSYDNLTQTPQSLECDRPNSQAGNENSEDSDSVCTSANSDLAPGLLPLSCNFSCDAAAAARAIPILARQQEGDADNPAAAAAAAAASVEPKRKKGLRSRAARAFKKVRRRIASSMSAPSSRLGSAIV